MPLNIKDRATEQSVRELAGLTGESVTTAVCRAAEERLQRVRRDGAAGSLTAELLEIGRRCAALPDLDLGRQTRSSAMANTVCHPDGDRHVGPGGSPAEGESDAERVAQAIDAGSPRLLSAASLLEASIVIESRKGEAGGRELDLLMYRAGIESWRSIRPRPRPPAPRGGDLARVAIPRD